MNVMGLENFLSGADYVALGLVSKPDIDTRVPGQPAHKLRFRDVAPFLLYWGFMYDAEGKVVPLKQDVNTGTMYGLVSRDQEGRAVVLNGVRVIFYSEALHRSCKIAEVSVYNGINLLGTIRTQDVSEAVDFITTHREDWKGFIEQSVLVDMSSLAHREQQAVWSQTIQRRLSEVTRVHAVTEQILDIDPNAEGDVSSFNAPPVVKKDPATDFPSWPEDTEFVSMSPEILSPPTRQDRPMIVQFTVDAASMVNMTSMGRIPENIISEIRRHVGYWLPVIGHRKDDCHHIRHCKSGFELILGLKIGQGAGFDAKNRKPWLENSLRTLKVQIESGTRPKKNGEVTCPAVPITIEKARCAYP